MSNKRRFRIDLWDQKRYRLETESGRKVKEIVILKSDVPQPVVCVVEDRDGGCEVCQYDLHGVFNPESKHRSYDLVMIELEPYVSDDFQIGPMGAYEHIEEISEWDGTLLDGLADFEGDDFDSLKMRELDRTTMYDTTKNIGKGK
jgi:hypothetical protein